MWYLRTSRRGRGNQGGAGRDVGENAVRKAYQVLGLDEGATEADVIAAHRRLMTKMHPDHGGSDYLASEINQAKETLIRHLKRR
ncbi:MAG: hypothetical protein D6758_11690 [Gammaproteobacteria bacterium]|nr:MAG: hypothetical protein D6758_11690 [Gammaproteobacteria bacterium]